MTPFPSSPRGSAAITDEQPNQRHRRSTYRLQLNADFGFDRAAGMVAYLAELGVSDMYTSPVLQAAPGSTHGYDVVDHSRLSEDLGGRPAFGRLTAELDEHGLGLTVDIVPNHMAIDGRANRWWWDVLENGPSSPYAAYFDIDWPGDRSGDEQTVLVPVLGERYGRTLDRGEIGLRRSGGSVNVTYFERELPLSPRTLGGLVEAAGQSIGSEELTALGVEFGELPPANLTDVATARRRHEEKERLGERLRSLCEADPATALAVDRQLSEAAGDPDTMDRLLRRQNYRLTYWKTGREELDYRRFFNIETLVGLRAEDDQVFADTHVTIERLVAEGQVDGLRVDHVDGLRDPDGYLHRLRRLAPDAYIAVEKILGTDERLPAGWPVQGTTGYDFATEVGNAFVDPAGEEAMTSCYRRVTGEPSSYGEVVRQAKYDVMAEDLAPEVDRLGRLLYRICDTHRSQRDRTRHEVDEALRAVLAAFPVYRTYVQPDRAASTDDAARIDQAVGAARDAAPETDGELIDFIGQLLLLRWPGADEARFAAMFPQLSAPVMAKGVEDTAFYRYHRLVSLNEVGGDPGLFGRPLEEFHRGCAERATHLASSMLVLATHDTKRSPDVRARISLLAGMPERWEREVTRWFEMTDGHAGSAGPDYNTRYLMFQTLVGAWPIGADRLGAYMDKAAKEAKVHTSWAESDADYDYSLRKFVESTLADERFTGALESFLSETRLVEDGSAASLSQQTLLLTCPGIPDLYQGTEDWDRSLVDPDNRRPVDFGRLADKLAAASALGPAALADGQLTVSDDRAKVWLTARLLGHRRSRPDLYRDTGYEAVDVTGDRAGHVIAFRRGDLLVLATRFTTGLGAGWGDTTVALPARPGRLNAVVGPKPVPSTTGGRLAELLGAAPVAVYEL